jgi:hypothetical protein
MRRPLPVTLVGWLFVLVGGGGIALQLFQRLNAGDPLDDRGVRDLAIVLTLRLIAFIGGVLVLRGAEWSRWLLAVWMAYHIWISLQHSWTEAAMHAVMFGALLYLLFRRDSSAYFRQAG